MHTSRYLIVGAGMTADAAIQGIRERDPGGSVSVIGIETHPPYDRPPLTKGLWKGKPEESIWRQSGREGVTLHLGRRAVDLNPRDRQITDDAGTVHRYEKLLLATGATPRRLPFGPASVIYYRSFDDYRRLRSLTGRGRRFAVIGGGFIGSEIAAALAMNGKDVVLVFPADGIGERVFPPDLSRFLNGFYREKGVDVHPGTSVVEIQETGDRLSLTLGGAENDNGREVVVDGVIAGLGVQPNIELAQAAGLIVNDGIRVDASLRTGHPDIYAAGDVASFHNPTLNQWLRVEHEDNANTMGAMAGRAMAGESVAYDHLPFFYSDLFELGYEAVGQVDSRLETVADWKEPWREGVVYYLRDRLVRGVLLWNVWDQVDAARRLIAEPGPFVPADLKGRLPA